ncbi:MAG: GNAT family N-acetyltransferase [bacterium]|nr:GNAT family N-acetyltransferase [bacterium]
MRRTLWPATADVQHRAEMANVLAEPEGSVALLYVADDGRALGFAETSLRKWADGCLSSPVGYLGGWFVAEQARRRGIGRALVEAAEDWARSKGCTEMASDTDLGNTVSETAHKQLGYEIAGRAICFKKPLG